jgi:hypothetical protein
MAVVDSPTVLLEALYGGDAIFCSLFKTALENSNIHAIRFKVIAAYVWTSKSGHSGCQTPFLVWGSPLEKRNE